MEIKRNRVRASGVKEVVADAPKQPYNYRRIQSLLDAHLQYTGRVSGKLYEWSRAGDVVEVLQEDVPELLSKRIGVRLCCGQNPNEGNRVFQELSEELWLSLQEPH